MDLKPEGISIEQVQEVESTLKQCAVLLKCNPSQVADKVQGLLDSIELMQHEIEILTSRLE